MLEVQKSDIETSDRWNRVIVEVTYQHKASHQDGLDLMGGKDIHLEDATSDLALLTGNRSCFGNHDVGIFIEIHQAMM